MDNNTLAIIISIVGSAGAIVIAIAVTAIVLARQSSRQDAETAALRAESNNRFDSLRTEVLAEIRAQGDRIENRIGLDERMRTVEQRTATHSAD